MRTAAAAQRMSSTIPVTQVASVLKLNVGDEQTAVKLDGKMKEMTALMRKHEGFESATRYVCKSEWAYELSFIFDGGESFGAWKTSSTRDEVHEFYVTALADCGIKEEDVYAGARVHDKW
jgi:antibiotic biosynthesis monooxygenase (ABM) superfamily enzyme